MIVLIWVGLFAITAVCDWISAKWVDSMTPLRRAHLSAVHEALGFAAGFTVYTWTRSIWTIIPCIAGAWLGSYLAGVDRGELDPEFVEAVSDAVALTLDKHSNVNL